MGNTPSSSYSDGESRANRQQALMVADNVASSGYKTPTFVNSSSGRRRKSKQTSPVYDLTSSSVKTKNSTSETPENSEQK